MNYDLQFDPLKRDMVFAPNGDFQVITDVATMSTQNGTILLEARAMNITMPQYGIGFNSQVLGGPVANAVAQLNRCVSQIQSDGGQASWVKIPPPPGLQFDFQLNVNYSAASGNSNLGPAGVDGNVPPATIYTALQGQTIGDFVMNSCGSISAWSDCLDANFENSWTPSLYAGEVLNLPATTTTSPNDIRALNTYPANNFTVPDIVSQVNAIFTLITPIS
jgi:hypothetical protein